MTRIAVAQTTTGIDPVANARVLEDAVAEAHRGGALVLFTPEMSGLLDRDRERARRNIVAEQQDVVLASVRRAAKAHRVWVHIGSLAIDPGRLDGRLVNRGYVVDDNGDIRARYDKLHLFDADLPTGEHWRESVAYAPGAEATIVDTPFGMLGLSICYDLRFPALYTALSNAGASVLAVPAAFTVPTGTAHWHVLLRARAIENAAFVVAAAQSGAHPDGRQTYGRSLVVNPWGEVVLDMGEGGGVALCDLELRAVEEAHRQVAVIDHRRAIPEVVLQ